jgi:polyketide cyclase/dehydrase/lipid transport protein
MPTQRFPYHDESTAVVHASAERVFAHLDDPKSLSAHMGESSMMMMGSRMSIDVDPGGGQIGSKIRMVGRVMGVPVSLEEVICERQPPYKKRWETVGTPKLIVIGHYRMGFDVTPRGDSSLVRVFIDYSLPTGFIGRCLGRVFGSVYAKWCTQRMARDAAERFPAEPVKDNT